MIFSNIFSNVFSNIFAVLSTAQFRWIQGYLKLEKPHRAKELCDRVLEKEPEQVKALYRRACLVGVSPNWPLALGHVWRRCEKSSQGHGLGSLRSAEFQLSNFAAAMKDLSALLKLQPNNSHLELLLCAHEVATSSIFRLWVKVVQNHQSLIKLDRS